MSLSKRPLGATAVLGVLLLGIGATTATADPAEPTPPPTKTTAAVPAHETLQFTLITGDVATATVDAHGTVVSAGLRSADGRDVLSTTFQSETGIYLYPEGAQELVQAGFVDAELFNLQALHDSGYDDASTDTLPVILEYRNGRAPRAATPGVSVAVNLESIGGAGATVRKDRAVAAWSSLAPTSPTTRSASMVETIWLDRLVTAADLGTPTVPLTGAGEAHAAGLDGDGVDVAVLDTGYDTGHPDLEGRVAQSQSFVAGSTVEDRHGHGTHVATTIAGTGTASDGKYAGMAPGADLLIGKVLDDSGSGSASGIIAGMEWAVDQGADVVSMSLGSTGRTCEGPDVAAIQALSDEALFVVAAGNSGLEGSVSTPGCAPKALTVGAVDRDNATATFSSRGPVFGGTTAKPDVASQGVRVVAGQAGGRGDQAYVAYSGTSMATPHVAGGAALLLDRHPDLAPERLKALLTSSATETTAPVTEQGAGPMDVARAVNQTVSAPANTSLGDFAFPQAGAQPTSATITLHNDSDAAVALDLTLDDVIGSDGSTLDETLVTLDGTHVEVPANGSLEVPLTVRPGTTLPVDAMGVVTGRLIGESAAGDRVVAPYSVHVEPPSYDLTVKGVDRFGAPAGSPASWSIIDPSRDTAKAYVLNNGSQRIRVRAGTYSVSANLMTRDEPTNQGPVESVAVMTDHEVVIDGPTVLEFDARDAQQIRWRTERPSQAFGYSAGFSYDLSDTVKAGHLVAAPNYVNAIYGLSSGNDPAYDFVAATRAYAPRTTFATAGGPVDVLEGSLALGLSGPDRARLVAHDAEDVDGAVVLLPFDGLQQLGWDADDLAERGAAAVLAYRPGTVGRVPVSGNSVELPMYSITAATAQRLEAEVAAGDAQIRWKGTSIDTSPYVYNLGLRSEGAIQTGTEVVEQDSLAAERATYHSQGDERRVYTEMMYSLPGLVATYASGSTHWVAAPLERVDYFSTDPAFAFTSMVMRGYVNAGSLFDGPRVREPGMTRTSWGRSPMGAAPSTSGAAILDREATRLSASVPYFADAAGHDGLGAYPDYRSVVMEQDGTRIYPRGGYYTLPQESVELALTAEWRRPASLWNTGLSYRTTWRLSSAAADQGRQHVLIPVVDVPVDGANRVPNDRPTTIEVAALDDATRTLARLDVAKVWYAVGDEVTAQQITAESWQPLSVRKAGHRLNVTVPGQAADSFVHLKVEFADEAGSSVEQVMVRAYGAS